MSDHIEVDGRKYYEKSYLILANANSKRSRERVALLLDELTTEKRRSAALEAALRRVRLGYQNILEFRKLGGELAQRDGFAGRYGALTREEIEGVIAEVDAAIGGGKGGV